MEINRNTVMFWINNYAKNNNIERKIGSGRQKITSIDEEEYIIDIIEDNNDFTLADIKDILNEEDITLSTSTIRRRLIENEYVYKFPIKKPLLTDDHKKKD